MRNLESELLEEVLSTSLVLSRLALSLLSVSVLKYLLHTLHFLSLRGLLDGLSQVHIRKLVTSGHDVVEIHSLDERFDLGSLLDSISFHSSCDLTGISIDTRDHGVSELLILGSVLIDLHDDGFTTSVSSVKKYNYLSLLADLGHFIQFLWVVVRVGDDNRRRGLLRRREGRRERV